MRSLNTKQDTNEFLPREKYNSDLKYKILNVGKYNYLFSYSDKRWDFHHDELQSEESISWIDEHYLPVNCVTGE